MDKKRAVDELLQLLRINTYLEDITGMTAGIVFIEKLLTELEMTIEHKQTAGRAPFLVATSKDFDDKKPRILLSGHVETILPVTDPTEQIRVEGDRILGMGTQDMKGGLMAMVLLLRELHNQNRLKNIRVAISTEEEQGPGNRYKHVIEDLAAQSDYILVFESTLDGFEEFSDRDRSIVRSRKGLAYVDIIIAAAGGHSGVLGKKQQRKSAVLKAAEFVVDLEEQADYDKGTTVNTGMFTAGAGYAVLAEDAVLKVDIRYIKPEERERILAWITEWVTKTNNTEGFSASYSVSVDFPPLQPNKTTDEFIKKLIKVAEDDGRKLFIENRGGGSEANLFSRGNPEAVILDGFGVYGDLQHTNQEYMLTESLFDSAEFALLTVNTIFSSD